MRGAAVVARLDRVRAALPTLVYEAVAITGPTRGWLFVVSVTAVANGRIGAINASAVAGHLDQFDEAILDDCRISRACGVLAVRIAGQLTATCRLMIGCGRAPHKQSGILTNN